MIKINSILTKPTILAIPPPPPPPFTNTYSMLHDGVNEYSSVGSDSAYQFGVTSPFSVSIWFKKVVGNKYIISRQTSASILRGWGMWLSTNKLTVDISDDRAANKIMRIAHNVNLINGQWYHVGFKWDGTNTIAGLKIFIDGVLSTSQITVINGTLSTIAISTPLHIGALQGVTPFSGNLDEVNIWDKALSVAEIAGLYDSGAPTDPLTHDASANLVGSWGMGDLSTFSGGNWTITDRSVSGLDAVTVNMEEADRVTDVPS